MIMIFFLFLSICLVWSARSYRIDVVVNIWLVGNAVFSETALMIFLIFCMKLGDYKGKKVTESDF